MSKSEVIDLEAKYAIGDMKAHLEESEQRRPAPEYSQRHITTLKAVSLWTAEEIVNHKAHNRLLQRDYSSLDPDRTIEMAVLTKEDWLTDWVCPNIDPALKLNIAADLVVGYQIPADDLNTVTQNIYRVIKEKMNSELQVLQSKINDVVSRSGDEIKAKAIINMKKKYPEVNVDNINLADENNPNAKILSAFIQVETQRKRKEVQHEYLRAFLQPMYADLAKQLNLVKKPTYATGQNNDFSFLGAAGSGKSTVASQILPENVKLECVVLATDDYRGVVMQDNPETVDTDQVFIKTQDTAYCIKELVQQRLESNPQQRPNIVLDCVTLEGWHRTMLANNASTISVVACLDDISLVPSRAYLRAVDDKSGPADKGRQVNTTSLLSGHRDASDRILASIPKGVKTSLFDTNVPRGAEPKVFAQVDLTGDKKEIEVFNLTKLSNFVCKAKVNVNASFPDELYRDFTKGEYSFTFDKHHQAEQVLMMVRSKPNPNNPAWGKPAYDMKLTQDGETYAKIVERDGVLALEILNPLLFRRKWLENSTDTGVLKSLVIQIHAGSLANARDNILKEGSVNQAATVALSALDNGPAESRVLQYNKPLENVPPYDLQVMSVDKEPTLQSLYQQFSGVDKNNRVKRITVIPLLIKDENNKMWIYGRSSDGNPQLNQIKNSHLYSDVVFPKDMNVPSVVRASNANQAIYNDLNNTHFHYYNYRVLRDDERNRRVHEYERYSAEYIRQYEKAVGLEKPVKPDTQERRASSVVFTGTQIPAIKRDSLKEISQVKPEATASKLDSSADSKLSGDSSKSDKAPVISKDTTKHKR
ncbi:MAG: AAA family ATPase [Candidatus Berkiella sp.]